MKPSRPISTSTLRASPYRRCTAVAQRMVFAHCMLINQDCQVDKDFTQELKIAPCEREIRQAQAVGIDGFALNAGGWLRQTCYIRYGSSTGADRFTVRAAEKPAACPAMVSDRSCSSLSDSAESPPSQSS